MLLMALLAPWAAKAQTTLLEEDFDAMSSIATSYSETDWFAYNAGSSNNWTLNTSSSYAHSGSNSAKYDFTSDYDANCYLVSSPFDVSAKMDELNISLYERVRSSTYAETFEVFLIKASDVTTAAGVVSATHYAAIASASYTNTTYAEATGTNSDAALAGQSVRLVVHCTSVKDKWILYIDDITVTETLGGGCPKPKNLEATNITAESATLGWTTSEAPSNGFNVRYRTAEIENPFFFDDFETNDLTGWTVYTDGEAPQSEGWYTYDPTGLEYSAHSGSYCASAWSWINQTAYNANNWLISPQVPLTGTLRFYVRTNQGYPDSYEVLLSTTGTTEADFTVELQAMAPAPTTGAWEEVSIDLKSYSGNGYIAIHHVSNDCNYLLIDDFGIYDDPTPAGAWVNKTTNTNSLNISSLTEETTYDFEVQSNCGGELSDWVASTFTTNPSCMPVADLTVSDATTTTISLTWTDQNSGSASYIITDGDDNPVTVTNLTITGCTVTGLTANTAYTFKVSADCGSTVETIQARTECNAIPTLPYNESFEGDTYYCWDLDGFNLLNNNTFAHTGNYSIFAQSITEPVYAILPATTTNISDLMLNFWWYNYYSGYDFGSLEVGYLTDIADYTTFVTVGTIDMSTSTSAYAQTDDYGFNGAPAGARIALKYTKGTGGSCIIIDDVTVDEAPDCMKPTDLDADPSATEAELIWTANSGETAWTIYYKKTSETTYATKAATTNPYILSPLEANTNYDYYVVANCSSTATSEASNVYSFKTDCGAITITATEKFIEDFEEPVVTATYSTSDADLLKVPDCWNHYTDNTSTAYAIPHIIKSDAGSSGYNYSNPASQVLFFYGNGNGYAALPEFTNPLNELQISFNWATESETNGTLTLGYITAEDNGHYNTFTPIGDSYTPNANTYKKMYEMGPIELTAVPTTATRLVFRWIYNTSSWYSCNIDDVKVELIPTCKVPTGLACTDYTATTATFNWTGAGDNQTAWQLYISEKNIAPADNIDESEVINVTTKPYTVPDLTAEKTYYAWVRGNCTASSEGYSEWVGGVEFMPSAYKDFTYNQTATGNTSNLPFYSYYTTSVTKGQMLVLASSFPENMADATVRRLTFYTTSSYATADWGDAEFDVLVAEVDATSFETAAFFNWDDMTTVFSGKLSVSNSEMVINFDTPYTYNGGNLLIGINLTTTGTSKTVYWVAYYGSTNLGAYQYSTNSVSKTAYQPKMTFNYLPTETPRPTNVHPTEELSTEATLAWVAPYTGTATGYEYQYKLATETAWSPAETTTELHATIAGLTPEKTYDFRVRAIYAGPAYSDYATTQCTTTAACAVPDGLAAANLTMNTADLTWNASTEVANYTVEYRTAATEAALFKEDFEDGIANWTFISMNTVNGIGGTGTYPAGIVSAAAHNSSNGGFRFSSYTKKESGDGVTYDQYLISHELTVTGDLKFYAWRYGTSDKLYYGTSTTTDDVDDFTWEELTFTTTSSWEEFQKEVTSGVKYIAFHYFGDYAFYAYLDDITIGEYTIPQGTWAAATTTAPNTGEYTIGGLTAGTKYDVRVYANCTTDPDGESTTTTFSTLADGTKVFNNAAGDNMWSTAGNWVPAGAPSITNNAVIRANVTITGDAEANKITFEGTTTPTLTINDGGTLQTNNNVNATVKKHITGYGAEHAGEVIGYYLIANPLNSTVSYSSFGTTGLLTDNYDFYSWSYTASDGNEWRNYKQGSFSLSTQTGYLYANESDVDLTFTGTVAANNTDVTKNLNYSSTSYDFNGWNLVGNPFACNAYTKDATDNVAAFYRMNAAGNDFEAATGAIRPMEGIFVKATASSQSFKFTRTAPVTSNGNGNLNISLAQVVTNRGEVASTDKAIVRFDEGNTLEKFMLRHDNMKIYIPQDGTDFAVVASDGQGSLPVNVKVAKTGKYTISISNEDVDFSYLHLIDNFTGMNIDLLNDPSYTFTASVRDNENRFILVFNTIDSNIDGTSDIFAYQSGDEIIVNGEGELQIFDVMGRFVGNMTVNGSERISASSFANGVYVFRMVGNEVKTQKIVVR